MPTLVKKLEGKSVIHVGAGANSCFAPVASGQMYVWGYGDGSVLGTGDEEDHHKPVLCDVDNLEGMQVLQVQSG